MRSAWSGASRAASRSSSRGVAADDLEHVAPKRSACLSGWKPSSTASAGIAPRAPEARDQRSFLHVGDNGSSREMKLEGIHHITAITGDAPGNVEFYTGVLGLRMVKQTVNQDDPTVYHLFYGDDDGSPGMDLTFFEYPGAARGAAGAGMVHRIVWRVGSRRGARVLGGAPGRAHGVEPRRSSGRAASCFADPEGLEHELVARPRQRRAAARDARRRSPPSTRCRASTGCAPTAPTPRAAPACCSTTLGFTTADGRAAGRCAASSRGGFYAYDPAPPEAVASQGAGTVHHVAFASQMEDHESWRTRAAEAGAHPTPVIDRFYFRSVYFREPSGVLFEIATIGPGFAVDEDAEHLGERLSLPPRFEPLRERLQGMLTPLPYPRDN